MPSEIHLTADSNGRPSKIIQLFAHLELYSEGEPARNTLFVLGRPPLSVLSSTAGDQLLLIDPPEDVRQRFELAANSAALFTGAPLEVGLPLVQTQPSGVAHLRIGEHFLDIYSQRHSNIVLLPALGILCGGAFGSDATLPALAPDSDGSDELETLRLLARLVKQQHLQLYIPSIGATCNDRTEIMGRLAADVAYFHTLRRVVPPLVQRGDQLADVLALADTLLPEGRRTALAEAVQRSNLERLFATCVGRWGDREVGR